MNGTQTQLRHELPPRPSSAGEARRIVRSLLADHGRDELVEIAQLLVSEVVTNALVHSGTTIELLLCLADDGGMCVEVGDRSPHLPTRRSYTVTATTGRGLALLEDAADDWGVIPRRQGKTVWFRISPRSGDGAPRPTGARVGGTASAPAHEAEDGSDVDTVRVELHSMPLLLHVAWQEHVGALLREYLLASADGESAEPIMVHAECADAMAVLDEQVPKPTLPGPPEQLMALAVEPGVSSPRVAVQVPVATVPHFATLNRTVEAALAQAEDGLLLIPPPQPELRGLRRWICGEVARQAEGGPATPWSPDEEPPMPRQPELPWDATRVSESTRALLAADDTDRIIAVSASAAGLLGHDVESLLGRRLVDIIPHRFRQAHLAGFTLHLLNGRAPLLDQPVVVPALRADGSEQAFQLTVTAERVGDHEVFIAEFDAPDDGSSA